ncbi:MAG: cupin domain-containing protein [Patescibacteria group bacterium]
MERSKILHLKPVFGDERGEIWDIIEGKEIGHIGLITSKKGAKRANHYHEQSIQYTFIISGKAEWYTKDLDIPDAQVEKVVLNPGDLTIVQPRVAHALVALEDTLFLDFTNLSRESDGYEKDTKRIQIV